MDTNVLAGDVHTINVLTVIANESYDKFARGFRTRWQKLLLTGHG